LVSSAKYLGVTIDAKLLFNHHIDVICKKANSTLSFLCRNFSPMPAEDQSITRNVMTALLESFVAIHL